MACTDTFEHIHEILRSEQRHRALQLLYDPVGDDVREPFSDDLNHAWYVIGDIYYRSGDYGQAAAAFRRSLEERPNDLESIVALGNTYSQLQDPELCERTLKRGLVLEPHNDQLLYNLGNALFDQGRYQDAIDANSRVSRRDELLLMKAKRNINASEERKHDRDA